MLADAFYDIWPYQIFKSVFFRSGIAFLTTYWVIVALMPPVIRYFRRVGITSDFSEPQQGVKPYTGSKPIMGGGILIFAILVSIVCWMELNQFIVALLAIMLAFGAIGTVDDIQKIRHRRRIEQGLAEQKSYTTKADGISGTTRLILEFGVATAVVVGLYLYVEIDGHLVVPFIPLDWWYPYLPRYLFVPFMVVIIVAGANAVNLTDGMDSLAIVPVLTCTLFVDAMHGEHGVEGIGRQKAGIREHELGAHQDGLGPGDEQQHKRGATVQNADPLMIDGRQPAPNPQLTVRRLQDGFGHVRFSLPGTQQTYLPSVI